MRISGLALTWALVLLALAWVSIVDASGPVRCTTYEQKTMSQLYTVCDDGSRAVSTWSLTLQRWETTVTPPPTSPDFQGKLSPQPKAPRR